MGGQYATWAGTILDRTKPLVLLAEPGREEEAALRLGRIGFDIVQGYLRDGILALESRPELVEETERIAAGDAVGGARVAGATARPRRTQSTGMGAEAHRGQRQYPVEPPAERLGELPRDRTILVHCAGGYRSAIAASILQQRGFKSLLELAGGLAAWEAAKLPLLG